MNQSISIKFNYNDDILLDKSYPLNIFNINLIDNIKYIFKFKKFRHSLIIATVILLKLLYLKLPSFLFFNYNSKHLNIISRDFIGIQQINNKLIDKYISILIYQFFKDISLIDDIILYKNIYNNNIKIKNNFKKKLEQKLNNNNIVNYYYLKKYFINNNLKYSLIYNYSMMLSTFYINMRNIMSCFYIIFDWHLFYYLFDKDLFAKEYGITFQFLINKKLPDKYKSLLISNFFLLNIYYKL